MGVMVFTTKLSSIQDFWSPVAKLIIVQITQSINLHAKDYDKTLTFFTIQLYGLPQMLLCRHITAPFTLWSNSPAYILVLIYHWFTLIYKTPLS